MAIISHHGSMADADLSYAVLGSYATAHEIVIDMPDEAEMEDRD